MGNIWLIFVGEFVRGDIGNKVGFGSELWVLWVESNGISCVGFFFWRSHFLFLLVKEIRQWSAWRTYIIRHRLDLEFQLLDKFVMLSRCLFCSFFLSLKFSCHLGFLVSNIFRGFVDFWQYPIWLHGIFKFPVECCFCVDEGQFLSGWQDNGFGWYLLRVAQVILLNGFVWWKVFWVTGVYEGHHKHIGCRFFVFGSDGFILWWSWCGISLADVTSAIRLLRTVLGESSFMIHNILTVII